MATTRRLAAILAADLVGYSRLIERDEVGTVDRLRRAREQLIDPAIAAHGGRIVRLAGDGALVEFPSVVEATQCAIEIQRGMHRRNAFAESHQQLVFRMGVNLGDILVEDDNLHGDGINVAARLENLAEPGAVLISEEVARHVQGKVDAAVHFVEERQVKNIERPVRIWRVEAGAEVPPSAAAFPLATRNPRWRFMAIAGVALAALIAAGLWLLGLSPSDEKSVPARREQTSLVVLPFENLSADPEQEYFADGITDDLITDLSQIGELFVIASHSAFAYKGQAVSVEQVGRELGVRYALEGTVRRAGGRVRINAQLTDTVSGGSLWAERYDRDFAHIFELQDEVSKRIIAALSLELSSAEQNRLAQRYTQSPEAYDLFLRGQQHYIRLTAQDNRRAQQLYRTAIELDPGFGRAYGALAVTYGRAVYYGWSDTPREHLEQGLKLAQHAVTLAPTLPQTHWALSFVQLFRREHEAAIAAAEKSVSIDPGYVYGYGLLAWIYTFTGEPTRAIEMLQEAIRFDPHPGGNLMQVVGQAHYWADHLAEAIRSSQEAAQINPNLLDGRLYLAAAYARLGRLEDAEWEAEEIRVLQPDFSLDRWLAREPYKDPRSLQRLRNDLQLAGLT